ncbi:hypothetical protein [Clostridium estertheticum]|uniref:hypothetical protein n=1 Tax=Clostridium estertheticum TaxID=238834 RepID=UPI001C7D4D57|nr:hypothetical protein [Clostridium estertheticum]MBX4265584.1 hypothetical protein [Clostridium estertheticum]MBX4271960.1 hypothetical protein [Clostridium estertheticum]WLC82067.1 hypothetical protein KTC98_22955 [Clostridium estertheticum]WLC91071.1 hypothetical protein KTC95_23540 [Clostridium estertheticum]
MDFDQKDKKYWKLGILYFNPLDNQKLIPKRRGIGVTFNFAHSIPLLVLIIAIFLLTVISIIACIIQLLL